MDNVSRIKYMEEMEYTFVETERGTAYAEEVYPILSDNLVVAMS